MDDREREILQYLSQGPAPLNPLLARLPKSSVYRLIGRLTRRGMIMQDGVLYSLLPAGREALADRAEPPPPAAPSRLEKALPHLRFCPTPVHRAVLVLVFCAICARRHRLRPSHHPSFIIYGGRLLWKSWLLAAACIMAGVDPVKNVIYLASESGRSILQRKGHGGSRVSVREIIGQAVVGLDEFLRAPLVVRRMAQIYLYGQIEVPDENEVLEIKPVPLVAMNPRLDREDLPGQLGLDEPMLRRAILARLLDVQIPPALLTRGEEHLEKMRELRPAEFPPPRYPGWDPQADVKRILLASLKSPELLAGIDVTMLSMLATAATAVLEREEALRVVMENYLVLAEQLDWLKPNWRKAMTTPNESVPPSTPQTPPDEPNVYDYDAKLHDLADVCGRLGLAPAKTEERLRLVEEIHRAGVVPADVAVVVKELRKSNLSVADAARKVAATLREHDTLDARQVALARQVKEKEDQAAAGARRLEGIRKEMEALGWDTGRIAALRELDRTAREGGVDPKVLVALHSAAVDVTRTAGRGQGEAVGLAGAALQMLAKELQRRGTGADIKEALRAMVRLTREGRTLEAEVARLGAEQRRLEEEGGKAAKALEALQGRLKETGTQASALDTRISAEGARLANLQQACDGVMREHATRKFEIAFSKELYQYLLGKADLCPELWGAFSALAQAAKAGRTDTGITRLSEGARRRLAKILKEAIEPDLIPRWELDNVRTQIRREEARRLREEFTAAATAVADVSAAVQEKLRAAQQAVDGLRWKEI